MRSFAVRYLAAVTLVMGLAAPLPAATDTATDVDEPPRITLRTPTAPFSGDYNDASVRDVIVDIARAIKMNAVVPADLTGNITAHFEKLPASQALSFVTGQADADYTITGNTINVTKRSVVIRPTAAQKNGAMADREREVERIARQIDEEDAPRYRAPARTRTEPFRIETYVSIQNSTPSYPAPAVSGGWGPLYHDGGFSYVSPPYITRFGPSFGAKPYGQPYGTPTNFPFSIYR